MVRRKQRSKDRITAMGLLLSSLLITAAGGAIALVDMNSELPAGAPPSEVGEVRKDAARPADGSETPGSDAEARETASPEAGPTQASRPTKAPKADNRRL